MKDNREDVGKEKEIIEIFIDKLLYHPYVCLLSRITAGQPFYCGWPLFRQDFKTRIYKKIAEWQGCLVTFPSCQNT